MFLIFHNGGVLFSLGFAILMCVLLIVVFNVLSAHGNKIGRRKFRGIGGVNRGPRHNEQSVGKRKRT